MTRCRRYLARRRRRSLCQHAPSNPQDRDSTCGLLTSPVRHRERLREFQAADASTLPMEWRRQRHAQCRVRRGGWKCSKFPLLRLLSRPDGCYHGKSGTQFRGEGGIIESDLDRNPLHDFGEISGRIVGRKQSELRSAGRGYLQHFSVNDLSWELVDPKFGGIADLNIGQLGFPVIGLYPLRDIDEGDDLCTR